ncbi:hypothetical protein D3C76_1437200 [compost metagenome]
MELPSLIEDCIGCFALSDAQVTEAASSTELQHQRFKPFYPILRAIVDAFWEVPHPAFLQYFVFAVGQGAFDDVANLVEVVAMPRGSPATFTGAAHVQVVIVWRAILAEQQVPLGQNPFTHSAYQLAVGL